MPGGVSDSSQLVGGDDSELTTKTMILLHVVERRRQARIVQGLEHLQRVEHAAHADVVGHAAVHEMDVRTVRAVAVGFDFLQLAYRARRGPRRIRGRR